MLFKGFLRTIIAPLVLLGLVACYRGADAGDPREDDVAGVMPWGTSLASGLTADTAGISFVTRHDDCCTVQREASFLVSGAVGAEFLYFDVRNFTQGQTITIIFRDGSSQTTAALDPGPVTVCVSLPHADGDDNGTVPIKMQMSKTLPDNNPNDPKALSIILYGVANDRQILPDHAVLMNLVTAH